MVVSTPPPETHCSGGQLERWWCFPPTDRTSDPCPTGCLLLTSTPPSMFPWLDTLLPSELLLRLQSLTKMSSFVKGDQPFN